MKKETVEQNTIFLTIAGSRAYGTNIPESDYDYRGICIIPDKTHYFGYGLNKFGQMDNGFEDDRVIYDIRKFVDLAANGNPNIIELLFTLPQFWMKTTKSYEKLYENSDKFLSKKLRFTLSGYAWSQLKRIKSHRGYLLNPPKKKPERSDFGLPERKMISSDHIGAYQWLIANLLKNSIDDLNLSDTTKDELREINFIGLVQSKLLPKGGERIIQDITGASDEFIQTMMQEKAYINSMNDWNAYQDWQKRRNQCRKELELKFGFDVKHAMHLVRLMRMCTEILETGKVNVYRPDREELLSIRNGGWTYEQIVEFAKNTEKNLDTLYQNSKLPKEPDRVFIDNLCCQVVEDYIYNRQ